METRDCITESGYKQKNTKEQFVKSIIISFFFKSYLYGKKRYK